MQEKFFELLRVAIGVQEKLSVIPSLAEWKELYEISRDQALLGICFSAIQKLDKSQFPPQEIYFKWLGWSAKIEKTNISVNHKCEYLHDLLHQNGFQKVCILKGQGNAALYPEPLLRQSGDIDVWVDGTFDEILRFVNSIKPTKEATDQDIDFPIFSDTEVELHYNLGLLPNPFKSKKVTNWFNECRAKGFLSSTLSTGEKICVPPYEMNLVYQLVHIYRHFFELGIGMRQIMDYYFLLKRANKENVDFQIVAQKVEEFGLSWFARSLMYVLKYVFGMSDGMMYIQPDERNGKFLLSEIMLTGNFGHSDSRIQLKDSDSHIKRFLKRFVHELRLFLNYPKDTFWNTLYIITIFFRYRRIRRML